MADVPGPASDVEKTAATQQAQQVIEPTDLEPLYANFARVSGLPEELILDFGLNPQAAGAQPVPPGEGLAAVGRELLHGETSVDGAGRVLAAARASVW